MNKKVNDIISKMTIEEKAQMCSGKDFWTISDIKKFNVKSLLVSDGPHGLRKPQKTNMLFLKDSPKSICFPTSSLTACSWDRELIYNIGNYLGIECQAENINLLLGPGINIKRSPLCGRNFEYFSEDPYLTSEMAINFINGVQSQGIGTSLKHFALNNQEYRRMSVDVIAEERTIREIYLFAFERVIKNSKPYAIISAFNKVNGSFCTQNKYLLKNILRNEWKYDGMVLSDWGAVYDIVESLKAGNNLEMPTSFGNGVKKIINAVKTNDLDEKFLDEAVKRILTFILKTLENNTDNITYNIDEHYELSKKAARESIVLLKNEANILPIDTNQKISLIGAFAKNTRFQGGGSSHINPHKIDNIFDEFKKRLNDSNFIYKEGYHIENDEIDLKIINEAVDVAKNSDITVIIAGLPDKYEAEGFDRKHLSIPENQTKLIHEISKVQKNIVVVLYNGSPITMPWIYNVKGILECYLGGQAVSCAASELIFGEENPCGKLAESFPIKLEDNPSFLNFPGEEDIVKYNEGIFVGYRYYDTKNMDVLFPFGYGLSYTSFEYTNIKLNKKQINDNDNITVSVDIKNIGKRTGKEIIQLYVRDLQSTVIRPDKELKNFKKILLSPNEQKTITFDLGMRDFSFYNTDINDWYVETGDFEILIGKSSRDICLKETVYVISTKKISKKYTFNSTLRDIMKNEYGKKQVEKYLFSINISEKEIDPFFGLSLYDLLLDMPIRSILMASEGKINENAIFIFLEKLNSNNL